MNYKIINSGSDGNATIIENMILIDCGVSFKKLRDYYRDLKLVFISHRHSDHMNKRTIKQLAENRPTLRFLIGDFLLGELLECGVNRSNIDVIGLGEKFYYGKFEVMIFKLYHDVPNFGLRLFMNNKKLIYATDTCTLEGIKATGYDYYFIEGNYEDEEELHSRAYNNYYESRVKRTHLSKEQATEWLLENMGDNSKSIWMHQHKKRER